jgi:hypothetical protein
VSRTALLILDALAVYRLAVLVTMDRIMEWPRSLVAKLGDRAEYFITCPWCTSIWLAVIVVVLTRWWHFWPYVAAVLAFSAVAGYLAERS